MQIGGQVWREVEGIDAFLLVGDSYQNSDLYYVSKFLCSDDFIYLNCGGEEYLLVNGMEEERARDESRVEDVQSTGSLEVEGDSRGEKIKNIVEGFLKERGLKVDRIGVVPKFPVGVHKELQNSFDVRVIENPLKELRSVKDGKEIEYIKNSQKAGGESIKKVKEILTQAEIEDGNLIFDREVLTSGLLKRKIEHSLIDRGFELVDCIVASGRKSSQPHFSGKADDKIGPEEPIIVDVFPRSKEKRYFGDMTRTFVKENVSNKLREMYQAVIKAQETALNKIEAGVKASKVQRAVCEIIRDCGFSTSKEENGAGFYHSTGHGIGLEIHEQPSVAEGNDEKLREGNVITIEPGLYDSDIGGVRIEDVVVVKERGYERLSPISKELSI